MDYFVSILSVFGIETLVALSAYLVLTTGHLSLGQQAFFGIGAYLAALVTTLGGGSLAFGLLLAALAGAVAALAVGALTLRMRGLYFAIATLAFGEIVRLAFLNFRYQRPVDGRLVGPNGALGFGGINYLINHGIGPLDYLALIVAVLAAVLGLFALVESSRIGAILRAVGEDEVAAARFGIDPGRVRLLTFAASGALAAVAGGLFAHYMSYVDPLNVGVMLGVHAVAYGIVGGLGTFLGPLAGVALYVGLTESLRPLQTYRMIFFGGLVVLTLIFRPRGLIDEHVRLRLRLSLRRLAPRRSRACGR